MPIDISSLPAWLQDVHAQGYLAALKGRPRSAAPVNPDLRPIWLAGYDLRDLCDECHGATERYVEDFGCDCPTCGGTGTLNPDHQTDESADFKARKELGTMPRLWGRGRGQL